MKRLLLPDLLKGLAAIFMVQIHITELFIDSAGRESLVGKMSLFLGGPFAAVIFMLVMGYFIAKNQHTIAQNMLRGLKVFLLGFLLNIGLNFHLLLKIAFDGWPYNPLEYLFGVDILYLAGLSILLLSALKSLGKGQGWAALLLLVVVGSLTGLMNEKLTVIDHHFLLPFIAGHYAWSYFPLFPWLAYPLAGYGFYVFEKKIMLFFREQKLVTSLAFAGIAILVIMFFKQGFATTISLPDYYHHTFGYMAWALGLTALWVFSLQLLLNMFPETQFVSFFCRIGKNITLFYVIQWVIIGNVATSVYQNQSLGSYPYWFAGIFTVSVLVTFLIEKNKFRISRKP